MYTVLYIAIGLLSLFALYFLLLMPRAKRKEAVPLMSAAYAHRGLWGKRLAENSLSAFRAAVEAGVGIELDVQLSADGEVVVFHDDHLGRVTGENARVREKTAKELAALSLSGTGEGVPTLKEVLAVVDGKVPLLVELKSDYARTLLCEKTAAILDTYKGPYMIESFHPLIVRWFRRHRPAVVRGQLYSWVYGKRGNRSLSFLILSLLLLNVAARPDFMAYDVECQRVLPLRLCLLWRPYRVVWTVRKKEQLLAAKGADTVIFESIEEDVLGAVKEENL
ncbi:MAG: glycerophosphodiester phosphodiesterase [Clostridia bacterium]|nr:glycerophosphodiester phosphodiesterase [Clostridia bacterium]